MPDHVHVLISMPRNTPWGSDQVHESQEFDLDCAKRRAKSAQFYGTQIVGAGYFISTVGRDEETIRT